MFDPPDWFKTEWHNLSAYWDEDWVVAAQKSSQTGAIAVQFKRWRGESKKEPVDLPCDCEPKVLEVA